MGNESGKSILILGILIILIITGAIFAINYAKEIISETKEQDLKTNMLLMQAEAKKGLEEVCFRTVNLDTSKDEDLAKINEVKQEYLLGISLEEAPQEVQEAAKNISEVTFDGDCYYLDEETLKSIGIENIDNENGYFIVKYNFSNANLEIINTNGYTSTQIVRMIEGGQS